MITEQYVTFETARMLKKAGFDALCNSMYTDNGFGWSDLDKVNYNEYKTSYSRSTQSLAVRWLREVHNIHLFVNYFFEDNMWFYVTVDLTESDEVKGIHPNESNYESYEEALEAGLQEALKLIKK